MNNDLNSLYELVSRFMSLSKRTGRDKSRSYHVEITFTINSFQENGEISISLGGYDIPDPSFDDYETITTTKENLLVDLRGLVDRADRLTLNYGFCSNCGDYTYHDEDTGKCAGSLNVPDCDEVLKSFQRN